MNRLIYALGLLPVILLAACTPAGPVVQDSITPAAAATPTLALVEDPVLYRDDFSMLNPDWQFSGGEENQPYSLVGDALEFVTNEQDLKTSAFLDREFEGDIFLDVDIVEIKPAQDFNFSLICHNNLEQAEEPTFDTEGYWFSISRRGELYLFFILLTKEGDDSSFLVNDSHQGPLMNAETNHVSVECSQERLALSINGVLVVETHDDTYHKGGIGFEVFHDTQSSSVRIDNLQISN